MVYCPKCGTKNEDGAKFCTQCGAPLYEEESKERKTEEGCFGSRERGPPEECFGLPHGREILGIVIGVLIIIWGLTQTGLIPSPTDIWPLAVIIVGILIIAGALYSLRRR